MIIPQNHKNKLKNHFVNYIRTRKSRIMSSLNVNVDPVIELLQQTKQSPRKDESFQQLIEASARLQKLIFEVCNDNDQTQSQSSCINVILSNLQFDFSVTGC